MAIELPIELDNGHVYKYFKLQWVRFDGADMATMTACYLAYKDRTHYEKGGTTDAEVKVVVPDAAVPGDMEEMADEAFLGSQDEVEVRGKKAQRSKGKRVN